ncbi:MAG: hypothetical protein QM820_32395 [Minicystis sp.]
MPTDEAEPLTPEEEAELQKEIELALKPYEGKTPPALLQQMREKLEEGLRSHPVPRSLLRRLAPRSVGDTSGEVVRGGASSNEKAGGGKDGA